MAMDIDELRQEIEDLPEEEFQEFREWFAKYDAELWDDQFEENVKSGQLDELAEQALEEHNSGETTGI